MNELAFVLVAFKNDIVEDRERFGLRIITLKENVKPLVFNQAGKLIPHYNHFNELYPFKGTEEVTHE